MSDPNYLATSDMEEMPEDPAATSDAPVGQFAIGFPVVGIGASAGGLAAFTQFLAAAPADSGTAFVLVQHLAPQHESQLAHILARETPMPVIEATDGMELHPDHVYIIPPNANLAMTQGILHLTPREPGPGVHLSIDFFMRSLAQNCGSRAIGVLLSGTGSDGSLGLAQIKAVGGVTFVQLPASAEHGEMPANAIAHGCADFILTPQEISQEIATMSRHAYLRGTPASADADPFPDDASYPAILATLKGASGIDFTLYRTSTIKRRIMRRMALCGASSLVEYASKLAPNAQETASLLKDVLINVTSFFRDEAVFEAMRTLVFPQLAGRHDDDSAIRIWVVACSTGQEAYSLAIALIEYFDGKPRHPPIQIFGTDISEDSLATARTGIYPAGIETEVSAAHLRRHFTKVSEGYRINKAIRDLCVFARHDVTADTPFSKIDLITCRNVLIYLTSALQARVIPILHYTLNTGGYLVLGSSETVGRASELFDATDVKHRVYVKKPIKGRVHPPVFLSQRRPAAIPLSIARASSLTDLQRAADRIVLGRYAPAGVLVDGALNVIQFRGKTSNFLQPMQGEASLNLLKMVPFGLAKELTRAIEEATAHNVTVRRKGIQLREDHHLREIEFEVSLVRLPGVPDVSVLILFEEAAGDAPVPAPVTSPAPTVTLPEAREYAMLKQELAAANDHLQTLIDENNECNDALALANDEAVSHNEELLCTNEELQTAKEEVESANEELATLNEELRHRNLELTLFSNDLTNLLDAIDLPIVMLGRDLRVRRVTRAAEKTLHLSPPDIGRHIGNLDLGFAHQNLEKTVAEVMATRAATDLEVRDRDGRWCSLRVTPYRTEGEGIDGAVVTCIDIDAVKRTQEILRHSGDFTKAIVETVRDPLLVLDADLRVHTANRAFFRVFNVTAATTLGQPLHALGKCEWDHAELRRRLDAILHGGGALDDFEFTCDFVGLGLRTMLLNARLLEAGPDQTAMIVLTIADVTGQRHLTDELKSASADLLRSNAELDHFASVASHDLKEPLRTITSYTDLLQRRLGDSLDDKCRKYMECVISGAMRMRDLIDAILTYSRVGQHVIAASLIDVHEALSSALFNLEGEIRDAAATVTSGTLPSVVADPVLLAQLMQNLVGNAIKFRADDRPPVVTIAARATDREWIISITDNGLGLRAEDTERIFLMFQRLHTPGAFSGTGIGLATCKKIVERHGGHLWVESTINVGSTFFFSLPKP